MGVGSIATLEKCFNNQLVFSGVVKIRKGLMCKVMLDTSHIDELNRWFYVFTRQVRQRVNPNDPSAARTIAVCDKILERTAKSAPSRLVGALQVALPVVLERARPKAHRATHLRGAGARAQRGRGWQGSSPEFSLFVRSQDLPPKARRRREVGSGGRKRRPTRRPQWPSKVAGVPRRGGQR